MADKITLTNLVNLQNETTAVNAINANNSTLTAALDNTLSRDGTTPNQMGASLDMNSNRIINLPAPVSTTEPVTLSYFNNYIDTGNGVTGLTGVPVSAAMQPVVAATPVSAAAKLLGISGSEVKMWPSLGHVNGVFSNYNVLDGFGNTVNTSSSTTAGFQEAINAAFQPLGSQGRELVVYGGTETTGGPIGITPNGISFPAFEGVKVTIGNVSFGNTIGGTSYIDSGEIGTFDISGQFGSLVFKPTNPVPIDLATNITDNRFTFSTASDISFDWTGTNCTGFAGNTVSIVELNAGDTKNGFLVPTIPSGANFTANHISVNHLHGIGSGLTALKLGNGAVPGGQVMGQNMYHVGVSADLPNINGVDTYCSSDYFVGNFDSFGTPPQGSIINFRSGANYNIYITPNLDPTTHQDAGTGNIGIGMGKITLGGPTNTVISSSTVQVAGATALVAGGGTAALTLSSTKLGIYCGTGAPTISAPEGSLYLRSDGASNARLYVNTNAGTGWVAFSSS